MVEGVAGEWDPAQYERFKVERAQPFWDLAELVHVDGRALQRCVDLGCGTGELTAQAASGWGCQRMLGVDNSASMLAEAERFESPMVRFEHGDIAEWTGDGDHDLVFSNAALQWVPDHPAVLRRWVAALAPGGQLAVQMPANSDHASHLTSVAVAHTEPFLSAMGGEPPADPVDVNVLPPEEYAELLFDLGFDEQHVRLQVYPHVLPSAVDVVEWTKGTSLTRFFKVLPPEMHDPFVDAYRTELLKRIGSAEPYLFTFKRILLWGTLG